MMLTQATSSSSLKSVRHVLGPEFAALSDQELAVTLKRGKIDAEAAEGFLDDLGQFAAKMAPVVLPVAGRALGTVIGGPAGGALGGQLGSLAGGLVTNLGQSETAGSALPNTRAVLGERFAGVSDAELSTALRSQNINPVAAEGFFDDLGKFAAKMAPVVLPVAGRVLGTVVGGPAGGALGGQLGSLAGGLVTNLGQGEATGSALPNTRAVLGERFAGVSDTELSTALRSQNINPLAAEGFLDDLGQFAAKIAPVVLPVAGRALGTVIGGPAGGALGGQLGSLAGGLVTNFGQSEATGSALPNTRAVLGERFAGVSDAELSTALRNQNINPAAAEGFLDDLGQFAAKIAPVVLPVAGRALGTVIGGPAGGALGGQLGSLAGGLVTNLGQSEATGGALPNTRAVLGERFASVSDAELSTALRSQKINPVMAEGFLDDLGSFAAKMAPVVLPVAGRALGTVIGGPAGGALGGQLGSLAGGLVTNFGQSETAETVLPNTRAVLGERFSGMSDAELSRALRSQKINPMEAEGFFDDLGKFARKMAPVVLPVAGRVLGSVVGGPVGGALGGQLGSLAGGLVTNLGQSEAAETVLPNTRALLGERFASVSDAELSRALRSQNINPMEAEGFFDDLGQFAAKMAPVVLPVAGRVLGSVVGGPAGGAIGGQLGSLAGGLVTNLGQSEAADAAEALSEWEAEADAAEALEIAELTEAYGLETEEA